MTFLYKTILITFVIFFFSSLLSTIQVLRPQKINFSYSPEMFNIEAEEITLKTRDDLELSSWYAPSKTDSVIIFLHGYPAEKSSILHIVSPLYPEFSLFLFDMRYFGKSEGKITTLGMKEKEDLKEVISFLKEKGYKNIGVFGFSLGGSVSLMTASEDKRIDAVATYGAFSDLKKLGREAYKIPVVNFIMVELMSLWGMPFIGGFASEISPEKTAEKIESPVLIIHNMKDEQISFNHALNLKNSLSSNPKAEFYFIQEGLHNDIPNNLHSLLRDFYKKHFSLD